MLYLKGSMNRTNKTDEMSSLLRITSVSIFGHKGLVPGQYKDSTVWKDSL